MYAYSKQTKNKQKTFGVECCMAEIYKETNKLINKQQKQTALPEYCWATNKAKNNYNTKYIGRVLCIAGT